MQNNSDSTPNLPELYESLNIKVKSLEADLENLTINSDHALTTLADKVDERLNSLRRSMEIKHAELDQNIELLNKIRNIDTNYK